MSSKPVPERVKGTYMRGSFVVEIIPGRMKLFPRNRKSLQRFTAMAICLLDQVCKALFSKGPDNCFNLLRSIFLRARRDSVTMARRLY